MRMSAADLAWMKGEGSYAKGDSADDGLRKAQAQGYKPGSEAHIAFVGGFLNIAKAEWAQEEKIAQNAK